MKTVALDVLEWLDAHPEASADEKERLLAQIPAWQWAIPGGHFNELKRHCCNRVEPGVERRPGNALNVEIGSPMPRCLFRSPDGRGLLWLLSGGSVLQYGHCEQRACERAKQLSTCSDKSAEVR